MEGKLFVFASQDDGNWRALRSCKAAMFGGARSDPFGV
jgi:hypothetical protein